MFFDQVLSSQRFFTKQVQSHLHFILINFVSGVSFFLCHVSSRVVLPKLCCNASFVLQELMSGALTGHLCSLIGQKPSTYCKFVLVLKYYAFSVTPFWILRTRRFPKITKFVNLQWQTWNFWLKLHFWHCSRVLFKVNDVRHN